MCLFKKYKIKDKLVLERTYLKAWTTDFCPCGQCKYKLHINCSPSKLSEFCFNVNKKLTRRNIPMSITYIGSEKKTT